MLSFNNGPNAFVRKRSDYRLLERLSSIRSDTKHKNITLGILFVLLITLNKLFVSKTQASPLVTSFKKNSLSLILPYCKFKIYLAMVRRPILLFYIFSLVIFSECMCGCVSAGVRYKSISNKYTHAKKVSVLEIKHYSQSVYEHYSIRCQVFFSNNVTESMSCGEEVRLTILKHKSIATTSLEHIEYPLLHFGLGLFFSFLFGGGGGSERMEAVLSPRPG